MKKNAKIISIILGMLIGLSFIGSAQAGSATLSWNANQEADLSGYIVYYGQSPRVGSCPAGGYQYNKAVGLATSTDILGLAEGKTYFFSLTAVDKTGNESCFSAEVSKFIPVSDHTPPVISSIFVSGVTPTSSLVSWQTDEMAYSRIEYGLTVQYGTSSATTTAASKSHLAALTSLLPNRTYYFRVISSDTSGNSVISGGHSFKTLVLIDADPPTRPADLSGTASSSSEINLFWQASVDNTAVDFYQVFRGDDLIATTTDHLYQASGLSPSTEYRFAVSAVDLSGNISEKSLEIYVMTMSVSSGQHSGGGASGGSSGGGSGSGGSGNSNIVDSAGAGSSASSEASETVINYNYQANQDVLSEKNLNFKKDQKIYTSLAGEPSMVVEEVSNREALDISGYGRFVPLDANTSALFDKITSREQVELSSDEKYAIAYFIFLGTETTKKLGAGERAGSIGSYYSAFGKLPKLKNEWQDVVKIANGRWPQARSAHRESEAEAVFQKIYRRKAEKSVSTDANALSIIAYGLRPGIRNMESERKSIAFYKAIFGHAPESAADWDVVRTIAYSGAKR